MKKVLFLAAILVLLFQVPAFAETKIGVFNLQRVVTGCDYGKAVVEKMKAKFEPLQAELERDAQELKKLEAELKTQNLALKLEAQQDKQREYRRKMRDLQDSYAAFQEKQQMEQQRLGAPVREKLGTAVENYCKANGFTIVFEVQQAGVAYIADGVDISQALIDELNKMKKAGK